MHREATAQAGLGVVLQSITQARASQHTCQRSLHALPPCVRPADALPLQLLPHRPLRHAPMLSALLTLWVGGVHDRPQQLRGTGGDLGGTGLALEAAGLLLPGLEYASESRRQWVRPLHGRISFAACGAVVVLSCHHCAYDHDMLLTWSNQVLTRVCQSLWKCWLGITLLWRTMLSAARTGGTTDGCED